jgi:hypothetical protein
MPMPIASGIRLEMSYAAAGSAKLTSTEKFIAHSRAEVPSGTSMETLYAELDTVQQTRRQTSGAQKNQAAELLWIYMEKSNAWAAAKQAAQNYVRKANHSCSKHGGRKKACIW